MSYYPKQFPVLDKTQWHFDAGKDLSDGTFDGTQVSGALTLMPGRESGVYDSVVIDPGQAVAWSEVEWEADIPEGASIAVRTRSEWSEEHCASARWSAKVAQSPAAIKLLLNRDGSVNVAAARYLQFRVELKAGSNGGPKLTSLTLRCGVVAPACVGPKNHGLTYKTNPTFYWTRVEGAASYAIELSRKQDMSDVVVREDGIEEPEFSCPSKLDPEMYYWRVRAADGTGQYSDWTPVKEFEAGIRPTQDFSHLKHPYLYFSRDDMPRIEKLMKTTHKETWETILENANEALTKELPDEKDILLEGGQHGDFNKVAVEVAHRGCMHPAFVYLFTGDEKYARHTRKVLLWLCGLSRWTGWKFGDANQFYPCWCATLETTGICKAVCSAYDWLYDYLSEQDRMRVRAGIIRLGILPSLQSWADPEQIRYIPRHQIAAGNWWSVVNSGGGTAALTVIKETPDAVEWLRHFIDSIRDFLSYKGGDVYDIHLRAGYGEQNLLKSDENWDDDGGYIESVGYAHYGFLNSLYFMEALKRVTGEELGPYINPKIEDFPYYFGYWDAEGEWSVVNFNDSGANNWSDDAYHILAKHTRRPRAKYLAEATWPVLKNINAVLAKDDSIASQGPDPNDRNKLFKRIGWSVFRSGWDQDANLIAAKFTEGRGHNDIGQYVIICKGHEFVAESGIVPYDQPDYHQYMRTSQAHNVVIVDNLQQIRTDGEVLGFAQVPGAGIVQADLTPAYQDVLRSWKRTLVYVEPGCFVVIDRLASEQERRFDWIVHPGVKWEAVDGVGLNLSQGDYQMQMHLVTPEKWKMEVRDGHIRAEEAQYMSFSPDKQLG